MHDVNLKGTETTKNWVCVWCVCVWTHVEAGRKARQLKISHCVDLYRSLTRLSVNSPSFLSLLLPPVNTPLQ